MQEQKPLYEWVTIPGLGHTKLLTLSRSTNHDSYDAAGSKTPWWMVGMKKSGKDVFSSTIDGKAGDADLSKMAELFGFYEGMRRECSSESTGPLWTSEMTRHDDCILYIPNGGYAADLENAMYKGEPIETTTIVCLGWFAGKLQQYINLTFTDSYLVDKIDDLDRVFLRLRILEKSHTFTPYDQRKATSSGKSVCAMKFTEDRGSTS
ncbi:hypothetical protein AGMMS50296_2690 [Alphaproteobacteria bacterium]|nr:hypothetical protein AGMMS50296_2690 [Alphaproteobacteria bacterium]